MDDGVGGAQKGRRRGGRVTAEWLKKWGACAGGMKDSMSVDVLRRGVPRDVALLCRGVIRWTVFVTGVPDSGNQRSVSAHCSPSECVFLFNVTA